MTFSVILFLDGRWVPCLDANDDDGAPYSKPHATRASAEESMAALQRDEEFAGTPVAILEEGFERHGKDGRPDFAGFAKHLREEAQWAARMDASAEKKGLGGRGDSASLNRLADEVEKVGRHLGYLGEPPKKGTEQ